jgi:hypothetical protein
MGSATGYQLRFSLPHALESTHGDTRITRLAIGEGANYVRLAMRSQELWREVESDTGAHVSPHVADSYSGSAQSKHRDVIEDAGFGGTRWRQSHSDEVTQAWSVRRIETAKVSTPCYVDEEDARTPLPFRLIRNKELLWVNAGAAQKLRPTTS